MTAIRDAVADGTLEILDAADVLLVSFGLSASGGNVVGSVWTLAFDASTASAGAAGTAAKAQIKNSGGTAKITGLTVGTAATDVVLSSTTIATAQNVILTSATITHP
ncbi:MULTISPECIES: hypothetical protein [unclassified Mesorhizobium]|uniref:hypothetical protein n=1 Tax=unclassified Mesorhizobium TaxID=325217 RepID=UPI001FE173CF|nr:MULTISPECIES: hypothetical protein [unclassified Mesorhizobium]